MAALKFSQSMSIIPFPGAYGFLIETSEGTVVYTGDFRFHGHKGRMTEEFAERAIKAKPACLITEGTRVSSEEDVKEYFTEAQVFQKDSRTSERKQEETCIFNFQRE